MRKRIATGRVFQRVYRDRKGVQQKTKTWFLKYYVHGKPVEEPASTENYDEAVCLLRQRMARSARKSEYAYEPERVFVNQLFDLVVEDYRFERRRSTYEVERRIEKHLRPFFGSKKAVEVTTTAIKKYVTLRTAMAKPGTVNKELAYLRRAFRLGFRHEPPLVDKVPYIRMLPLNNARRGIVPYEHYRTIRDALPSYARIALVIGYHTGARKGEIQKIRTEWIDFKSGRIELPAKITKNQTARYLPIYGEMEEELQQAIAQADPRCPFLIQHEGKPVFSWRKSWKTACQLANMETALFHDLRRTAITNMMEAEFSEKEAMDISGHKTRSVFDRYHIVSEQRLQELGKRLEKHLKAKEAGLMGSDSGVRQNA